MSMKIFSRFTCKHSYQIVTEQLARNKTTGDTVVCYTVYECVNCRKRLYVDRDIASQQ